MRVMAWCWFGNVKEKNGRPCSGISGGIGEQSGMHICLRRRCVTAGPFFASDGDESVRHKTRNRCSQNPATLRGETRTSLRYDVYLSRSTRARCVHARCCRLPGIYWLWPLKDGFDVCARLHFDCDSRPSCIHVIDTNWHRRRLQQLSVSVVYLRLPLGSIHGDRWIVGQGPEHRHFQVFALRLFPRQHAQQNRAPVVAVVLRQHLRMS